MLENTNPNLAQMIPAPSAALSVTDANQILANMTSAPTTANAWLQYAKAQHAIGSHAKALKALNQALTLDATLGAGLQWWLAIYQNKLEQQGTPSAKAQYRVLLEAEKRFNGVPLKVRLGCYCAAYQQRDLAIDWFTRALSEPISAELLHKISTALFNQGWYTDLVDLIAPQYYPEHNSLPVGMHLLQAYIALGEIDAGEMLIRQILEIDPNQQAQLQQYQQALEKLKPHEEMPEDAISWNFMTIPIWCYGFSKSPMGFEPEHNDKRIVVIQFTYDKNDQKTPLSAQDEEILAPLTRAIPLYLSQQVHLHAALGIEFLFPVHSEKDLIVMPAIPVDKDQIQAEFTGQYTGVLMGEWIDNQWVVTYLDLDNQQEATLAINFDLAHPDVALADLETFIFTKADLDRQTMQAGFSQIPEAFMADYLAALDQHLRVYVAWQYPMHGEPVGLQNIIHHLLDLAIALPILQTQLALISLIQKCMRIHSLIIKDSKSVLQAWLDESAKNDGLLQDLTLHTEGEFRAYCED